MLYKTTEQRRQAAIESAVRKKARGRKEFEYRNRSTGRKYSRLGSFYNNDEQHGVVTTMTPEEYEITKENELVERIMQRISE